MVYIIICFIVGIAILIAEIFSIITTIFYGLGYGFISILIHTIFIFFGLIFIIAAIKDYCELKKDKNKKKGN